MTTEHIGNGVFMLGDCFERMAELPDASVDMILADLPYGTTACAWDSVLPLDALWKEYRRIARRSAPVVLMAQTPFDKVLGVSNIADLRYEWVWEKTAATGFLNAKKFPLKAHENVLVFYDGKPTYNPQKTQGHLIKRVKPSYANHGDSYGKAVSVRAPYESTERYPRDILLFPKDNKLGGIHPTQKPVALFEYLIRTYTDPGDLVFDNTAGSGTTAIAAENAGRRRCCIERDPTYYAKAVERVRRHTGEDLV